MAAPADDRRFDAVLRWLAERVATSPLADPLVVLCAEAPGGVGPDRVGVRLEVCVRATPAHRLVDLVGIAGRVVVVVDRCVDPDPGSLVPLVRLLGDRLVVGTLAARAGGTVADVAHPPLGRRGLLGRLQPRDAQGEASEAPVIPRVADETGRLIASLRRTGVSDAGTPSSAAGLVATVCTACGLCVRTCPHDALRLTHAPSTSELDHLPDRCRGEEVCVAVCPVVGLTTSGPLPWGTVLAGEPRHLLEVTTHACARCRARTTGPGLCDACAYRRANPFGSAWPPRAGRPGPVDDGF